MFQPNMSYEWWVHWLFQCLPYSVYYCCSVLVPVTSLVPCDVMHGQYWAVLSDCRSYSIEVQQLLDDGSIGSNNQLTADSNQALAASGSLINPLTSPYPLHPYYLASFTLSYTPCWIPYSLYCTDTPLYRHFTVLPLYQLCTDTVPTLYWRCTDAVPTLYWRCSVLFYITCLALLSIQHWCPRSCFCPFNP